MANYRMEISSFMVYFFHIIIIQNEIIVNIWPIYTKFLDSNVPTTVHRARSSSWMAFFICQSKNLSVITFLSEFLGKLCSILWKKTLLGHTKSSEEFLFFFFFWTPKEKYCTSIANSSSSRPEEVGYSITNEMDSQIDLRNLKWKKDYNTILLISTPFV